MRTLFAAGRAVRGAVLLTALAPGDPAPLDRWNRRQARTLQRWARRRQLDLSPEVVLRLATRYAAKHARERSTLLDARRH